MIFFSLWRTVPAFFKTWNSSVTLPERKLFHFFGGPHSLLVKYPACKQKNHPARYHMDAASVEYYEMFSTSGQSHFSHTKREEKRGWSNSHTHWALFLLLLQSLRDAEEQSDGVARRFASRNGWKTRLGSLPISEMLQVRAASGSAPQRVCKSLLRDRSL